MDKKVVFITGIAGFIGFHIALKLVQQGHKVIGCDNFNDYYDPNLKKRRIKELEQCGVLFINGDILNDNLYERLSSFSFNHVIHLAAQAGVRYSMQDPFAFIDCNIMGFVKLLEYFKDQSLTKFVYASSSSVYGATTKNTFSESDNTDTPTNVYGASKKANELLAYSYHHMYGMPLIGLRFFTVYGPWGRPDMALFKFTKAIDEDTPIDVYNHGEMFRDFTYIDDIVDGTIASLYIDSPFDIFNLGNSRAEPLMDLVGLIEKHLNKSAQINFLPMPSTEIVSSNADISKSQKQLNYQPKVNLEEGVKRFMDWYKNVYKKLM